MSRDNDFIEKLLSYAENKDRAALAALRRGLGKNIGEATEPYRYIFPYLPSKSSKQEQEEKSYYLVGSLFALHQKNWESEDNIKSNFGASFARLNRETESDSIEKRFTALLNSQREDLPNHLRHAVALLKSKEIPVNWLCLLTHLKQWDSEDRWVQRTWARSFWTKDTEQETTEQTD